MYEIKFVTGFTKKMFDDNRQLLSVSTNINYASQTELQTLIGVSAGTATRILNYLQTKTFTNTYDLYTNGFMTLANYEKNQPFMDLQDNASIDAIIPEAIADINTSTQNELVAAGLTVNQANIIVQNRGSYSYKTLGEIVNLPGMNLSAAQFNALQDNLTVNATTANSSYLNINLASAADLQSLGLSANDANRVSRASMNCGSKIPVDLSAYDRQISLYTNINTASVDELLRLDTDMTSSLVSAIVSYRNDQPFGSASEVRTFFANEGTASIYSSIQSYIVLR